MWRENLEGKEKNGLKELLTRAMTFTIVNVGEDKKSVSAVKEKPIFHIQNARMPMEKREGKMKNGLRKLMTNA